MSVGEIASALHISHASVSEARRSLMKAGIVASSDAPDDRRRRSLSLTSDGQRLVEQLQPLWEAFNATAGELNAEAGDVVKLLDRLDDALKRRSMYDRILDRIARQTKPADTP